MANCTSKFWTPLCFTASIVPCQSKVSTKGATDGTGGGRGLVAL